MIDVQVNGEEVTVVEQIQVDRCTEYTEWGSESFEPQLMLEGGRFPESYALSKEIADEVWMQESIDVEDHGIRVIDIDDEEVVQI